jgi:hypothetical protein
MAEHIQGTMDITAQEKTFNGFITFVKVSVVAIIAILVFMALANG